MNIFVSPCSVPQLSIFPNGRERKLCSMVNLSRYSNLLDRIADPAPNIFKKMHSFSLDERPQEHSKDLYRGLGEAPIIRNAL